MTLLQWHRTVIFRCGAQCVTVNHNLPKSMILGCVIITLWVPIFTQSNGMQFIFTDIPKWPGFLIISYEKWLIELTYCSMVFGILMFTAILNLPAILAVFLTPNKNMIRIFTGAKVVISQIHISKWKKLEKWPFYLPKVEWICGARTHSDGLKTARSRPFHLSPHMGAIVHSYTKNA